MDKPFSKNSAYKSIKTSEIQPKTETIIAADKKPVCVSSIIGSYDKKI